MDKKLIDEDNSNNLHLMKKKYNYKEVDKIIEVINHRRIKYLGIVTIVIELVLILFYDLPNINKTYYSRFYLLCHFIIFSVSTVVVYLIKRTKKDTEKKIPRHLTSLLVLSFMIVMSFVGYMDQMSLGNLLSYITMLLLLGTVFFIKPPNNYIIYTLPQVILLSLIIKNNEMTQEMVGNIINLMIFWICMLVVTKISYENQYIHIMKNIELEEINEKLKYASNFDFLTDLPNRNYFEDLVKKLIKENESLVGNSVIAIMDVDFFKRINDDYGHNAGDWALKEISTVLKDNLCSKNLIARWGGEEFIFFLPETTLDEADKLLNNLRQKIKKIEINVKGHHVTITASFGFASFFGDSEEEYIKAFSLADEALYRAKNEGRDRVIKEHKVFSNKKDYDNF